MSQMIEAVSDNIGQIHITPDAVECLRNEAEIAGKNCCSRLSVFTKPATDAL